MSSTSAKFSFNLASDKNFARKFRLLFKIFVFFDAILDNFDRKWETIFAWFFRGIFLSDQHVLSRLKILIFKFVGSLFRCRV